MNRFRRKLSAAAASVSGWVAPVAIAAGVIGAVHLFPAASVMVAAGGAVWWLDRRFVRRRLARRVHYAAWWCCQRIGDAVQATPVWVFVVGPRLAVGPAVAVGCQLALAHALGVSANPVENVRELAAMLDACKGGTP